MTAPVTMMLKQSLRLPSAAGVQTAQTSTRLLGRGPRESGADITAYFRINMHGSLSLCIVGAFNKNNALLVWPFT